MRDTVYLLDISPLREMQGEQDYIQQALGKLDECRRKKAESIKKEHAKAASIGAGLLLQWAAHCLWYSLIGYDDGEDAWWFNERLETQEATTQIHVLNVEGLLAQLDTAFPLTYRYGKNGKPYWEEVPLYFSLSHSGKYVLCAVSEQEIGADIQEMKQDGWRKTAERYFSKEELDALKNCDSEEEERKLFFRLWTRKEARGKLTGQGVAEMLSENMLEEGNINWLEPVAPDGYAIAVCVQGGNLWEDC